MARYIDADTIVKDFKKNIEADSVAFSAEEKSLVNFGLDLAIDIVNATPTADVEEVVRCKDCKHFTAGYCCRDIKGRSQMHYMGEEAFCSYGERRTDNDL